MLRVQDATLHATLRLGDEQSKKTILSASKDFCRPKPKKKPDADHQKHEAAIHLRRTGYTVQKEFGPGTRGRIGASSAGMSDLRGHVLEMLRIIERWRVEFQSRRNTRLNGPGHRSGRGRTTTAPRRVRLGQDCSSDGEPWARRAAGAEYKKGIDRCPLCPAAATAGRSVDNALSRRAVCPTPCARPGDRSD
jgi:hypothetical protein